MDGFDDMFEEFENMIEELWSSPLMNHKSPFDDYRDLYKDIDPQSRGRELDVGWLYSKCEYDGFYCVQMYDVTVCGSVMPLRLYVGYHVWFCDAAVRLYGYMLVTVCFLCYYLDVT